MERRRSRAAWLLAGVLVLAGGLTPVVAHAVGGRCWIYLPAHVPALLAGLGLGPFPGLAVGFTTGVVDELAGGRLHGLALLPIAVEFVVYGGVAGWLGQRARSYGGLALALVGAMLAGRLAHLAVALFVPSDKPFPWLLQGLFVTPWPGMAMQLVFLPLVARWLRRTVSPTAPRPTLPQFPGRERGASA